MVDDVIDWNKTKEDLEHLDWRIQKFRETSKKKYSKRVLIIQLTIAALSIPVWFMGYKFIAICLFVAGFPFSDEWYEIYKDWKDERSSKKTY